MRNLNKITLNSLLVLAVLGVWGWVLRSAFEGEPSLPPGSSGPLPAERKKQHTENRYAPAFDYADPFLKHVRYVNPDAPVNVAPRMKAPTPHPPRITPWPNIHYFGLIRNDARGRKLGLLSIDDASHLIYDNTQLGDIVVRSYNADSAVLALNDEIRSYKTTAH